MKSYTNIEQSKRLSEILPIDNADMCWVTDEIEPLWGVLEVESEPDDDFYVIPCWSLAALLEALPQRIHDLYELELGKLYPTKGWYVVYNYAGIDYYVKNSNLIDACVEMIIKLHEDKLL